MLRAQRPTIAIGRLAVQQCPAICSEMTPVRMTEDSPIWWDVKPLGVVVLTRWGSARKDEVLADFSVGGL